MTFSDFIKTLVEQTPYNFGRGEQSWQNFLADNETLPAVYLDEPITGTFKIIQGGGIQEVYELKLMILQKSQLDWTPEQHAVVIDLARQQARKLTILINESESVQSFQNPKILEFKNLFDCNMSGVVLTSEISFYSSFGICVNAVPQSDFVHLSNSNEEYTRTVPNGSNFTIPNTMVELVDNEGNVLETVYLPSVSGGQIEVTVGGEITVSNSNNTYSFTTNANLTLPDTNVNVYVDGVLSGTGTIVTLDSSEEINVLWT
jgi:hypothetical protein